MGGITSHDEDIACFGAGEVLVKKGFENVDVAFLNQGVVGQASDVLWGIG